VLQALLCSSRRSFAPGLELRPTWDPAPARQNHRGWGDRWLTRRTSELIVVATNAQDAREATRVPWLEGVYLNNHVIEDPASAALELIGGLDGNAASGNEG